MGVGAHVKKSCSGCDDDEVNRQWSSVMFEKVEVAWVATEFDEFMKAVGWSQRLKTCF
jgi:hypothetical protein